MSNKKKTKKENTGVRELNMSGWIRENLPCSSTGFIASDIDFYIYNYRDKIHAMLEVKTRGATLATWQEIMYENLDKWMKRSKEDGWEWRGVYTVQFENKFFKDGKCWINGEEVTEAEAIELLSLRKEHKPTQNSTNEK